MKIVITGGAGFIGQELSKSLISQGHHVVIIDSLSPQIHGGLPNITLTPGVEFHRINILDLGEHSEILENTDIVFHLAAETGTGQSMYQISHYVRVNELGTAALLEAISKCQSRPKKVILASSRSIYGEGAYFIDGDESNIYQPTPRTKEQLQNQHWDLTGPAGQLLKVIPTPEKIPPRPGSVYAATKFSQEMLLNSAASALGFKSVIFRFQNVFGEGQSLRNPYTGIISIFYNRARQGLEIPIYEDGLESRDFVHVSDVVSALNMACTADLESGECLNVGSGEPTSVIHLAKTLLSVSGFDVSTRITGQFRVGDIRHCYADMTNIKEKLGFIPKIRLKEGLERFSKWAITQPVFEDKSASATAELQSKGLA